MMTDAQNTPARTNNLLETIQEHFAKGGRVMIATYTRATVYSAKHADWFAAPSKPGDTGVYVRQGRGRVYVFPQYVHLVR